MSDDPLAALADRLGVSRDRLDGLSGCMPADLAELDTLVAAAFAIEDEAVESGLQRTVSAVPRPLRGKARALLFPEGAG
jgi:hypothetical protein